MKSKNKKKDNKIFLINKKYHKKLKTKFNKIQMKLKKYKKIVISS